LRDAKKKKKLSAADDERSVFTRREEERMRKRKQKREAECDCCSDLWVHGILNGKVGRGNYQGIEGKRFPARKSINCHNIPFKTTK